MAALRDNRRLRTHLVAWTACVTSDMAATVGLSVLAFRADGVFGVGVMETLRCSLGAVLGTLLAGFTARRPARRALQAVLVTRALAFVGYAGLAAGHPDLALVVALAVLDASVYSRYWPTLAAELPAVADTPEQLAAANIAAITADNVGNLTGPALAAAAIAWTGVGSVFAGCSGLALLGYLTLAGARGRAQVPDGAADPEPAAPRDALRVLRTQAAVRLTGSLYLLQVLVAGAVSVLVVATAVELTDLGETGVGVLGLMLGLGGVAGSVLTPHLVGRRLAGPLVTTLAALAAALATIAAAPGTWVTAGCLAVAGAAAALSEVSALTVFQRVVRARLLGPVMSLVNALWWAAYAAGAGLAGYAADRVGLRATLLLLGVGLFAAALVGRLGLDAVEAQATVPVAELAALRSIPWFSGQPPLAAERLAFDLVRVQVAPGEVIVRRGDAGDRFYLVAQGTVAVDDRLTLGPGEWFGEIALLWNVPRTATVTALTECTLYALGRADFLAAISSRGNRAEAEAALAQPPPWLRPSH
jgi:predicted MFS family arabinose efflux permease